MAKVTGPLYSMSASGKIGNAMVHFAWKGINVVREWLIPSNPQSAAQGNIRTVIAGIGRAVGMVDVGMQYDVNLRASVVLPDQQTKQSYLVQYIKDHYVAGSGATLTAAFAAILAELTGHTAYTSWTAGAVDAGITDFSLTYDSIATFEKGLGLYLLAKAAVDLGFSGSPYTKTLAKWTATHIDALVADLST
jgi:hypothetical protein